MGSDDETVGPRVRALFGGKASQNRRRARPHRRKSCCVACAERRSNNSGGESNTTDTAPQEPSMRLTMLSPGHAGVIHRALCEDSQSSAADPASSSSAPSHAYPPSRVVRPRLSPALASHLNLGWAVANFEGTPVHSGSIAVKISARRFVRIELQSCAWGPRKLIHEPLRLQPLKSSPKISQSHRAVVARKFAANSHSRWPSQDWQSQGLGVWDFPISGQSSDYTKDSIFWVS